MSKYSEKKKRQAEGTYVPPVAVEVAVDFSHLDTRTDREKRLEAESAALREDQRARLARYKGAFGKLKHDLKEALEEVAELRVRHAALKTRVEVYERMLGAISIQPGGMEAGRKT